MRETGVGQNIDLSSSPVATVNEKREETVLVHFWLMYKEGLPGLVCPERHARSRQRLVYMQFLYQVIICVG